MEYFGTELDYLIEASICEVLSVESLLGVDPTQIRENGKQKIERRCNM